MGLIPCFLIKIDPSVGDHTFIHYFDFSHILNLIPLLPSSSFNLFVLSSSGKQWKLFIWARLSIGCTKLDPTLGPEGKPVNYYSSLCHRSSCCLSPSICGQRESVDRPACFYLCSISIQGDEACQGFTGTGNLSLRPGISVA